METYLIYDEQCLCYESCGNYNVLNVQVIYARY
jgi:hypothetical protein